MHVTLSVIGLDRISTSFALALKRYQSQSKAQHTFAITGSDPSPQAVKAAQKLGAIDSSDRKPSKAVANADLVIVKCPPGRLADSYAQFGPALKPGAVVLDLSDLKEPVIALARKHFPANERGASLAYIVGVTPIVSASGLYAGETGPAVVMLNVGAVLLALSTRLVRGISRTQALAIAVETGLQNAAIAIFICTSLLGRAELAVPALVYAVVMNLTALALVASNRPQRQLQDGGVAA